MSGEVSRSYDGPDDRDTKAMVRRFMAEQARSLEEAGYCAEHALPRETCPHCKPAAKAGP